MHSDIFQMVNIGSAVLAKYKDGKYYPAQVTCFPPNEGVFHFISFPNQNVVLCHCGSYIVCDSCYRHLKLLIPLIMTILMEQEPWAVGIICDKVHEL